MLTGTRRGQRPAATPHRVHVPNRRFHRRDRRDACRWACPGPVRFVWRFAAAAAGRHSQSRLSAATASRGISRAIPVATTISATAISRPAISSTTTVPGAAISGATAVPGAATRSGAEPGCTRTIRYSGTAFTAATRRVSCAGGVQSRRSGRTNSGPYGNRAGAGKPVSAATVRYREPAALAGPGRRYHRHRDADRKDRERSRRICRTRQDYRPHHQVRRGSR